MVKIIQFIVNRIHASAFYKIDDNNNNIAKIKLLFVLIYNVIDRNLAKDVVNSTIFNTVYPNYCVHKML